MDEAPAYSIREQAWAGVSDAPPRLARLAVATIFFVNGAAQANWVARIPAIQTALDLGSGALGAALFGLPLGLLLGAPAAGGLAARFGSRRVTRAAALAYCALLPLPALAANVWLLLAALAAVGVAAGALDVAMNVQGSVVEWAYRRPIMTAFHGLFSLGGLAGAAVGGALAALGIAPLPHLLGAGLALGALALAVSRWLLVETAPAAHHAPAFALPGRALLGLAAIAFCVLLAEGAVADWSAVYLNRSLAADPGLAVAGFAAFSLTMAAGRLVGDRVTARLGPTPTLRLGGLVAAVGMLAALLAGQPVLAVLGFGGVGAGAAVVFPIVVSAAGRAGRQAPATAIAAVTTVGYLGFLAGPPLIGLAAELVGLRGALGLVVALAAAIALLAPAAAPAGRE